VLDFYSSQSNHDEYFNFDSDRLPGLEVENFRGSDSYDPTGQIREAQMPPPPSNDSHPDYLLRSHLEPTFFPTPEEPTAAETDAADLENDLLTGVNSENFADANAPYRAQSHDWNDAILSPVDLGIMNGTQTAFGGVYENLSDGNFYQFNLTNTADFSLYLDGLSADADVQLIRDANNNNWVDWGEVIGRSFNYENSAESITVSSLQPGTYFVNIYPYSGSTAYNLTLSATPSAIAPPEFDPNFSTIDGYGTVDASAAVEAAIATPFPFPEVPDLWFDNWGLDSINAPEVWNSGYTGAGVVVAVIDTGVDYTHPELANNIWQNLDEIPNNGIDDDANGFIDDTIGWDFIDNDADPMDYYGFNSYHNGHGTHVAGTIAAADDGWGMTGVAPGAQIMPIRALSEWGDTYGEFVANGIYYAVNNGADVINLSLSGGFSSLAEEQAIQYATEQGVVVVMAAGNYGDSQPTYPAYYATNFGIAVGAVDYSGNLTSFSNRSGSAPINYVTAPGESIYSTIPGHTYDWQYGTSMAAPHVSGTAALMLSANPNLTPEQVEDILTQTAGGEGIIS